MEEGEMGNVGIRKRCRKQSLGGKNEKDGQEQEE